jgi:hypothetical protein
MWGAKMARFSNDTVESVFYDPVIRGRELTKTPTVSDSDGDVNIYLINLVCNFSSPNYLNKSQRYVLNLPINMMIQKAYDEKDKRERFNYFVLNAEYVLFMLGVMFNVDRVGHVSRYRKENFSEEDERKAMCFRSKILYGMAASTLRNLRGKNTLSKTLEKISDDGVEKYVRIVRAGFDYALNSESSNVALIGLPKQSDEPLKKSIDEITNLLSESEVKILKEDMLKLYSMYLENPILDTYKRMNELENLIQKNDAGYLFSPIHNDNFLI